MFVSNLALLTLPRQNSDWGISDFWLTGQSLMKINCHNSRTSDDIDMKLRPVTKIDKRNKTMSKHLTMRLCRKIVTSLPFLQYMANSEQSKSRILDALSVKLIFLLIVIFYLAKTEIMSKKSLKKLSHYCFE